jgi:hypothetical protein
MGGSSDGLIHDGVFAGVACKGELMSESSQSIAMDCKPGSTLALEVSGSE